jgi:hypothetical protein
MAVFLIAQSRRISLERHRPVSENGINHAPFSRGRKLCQKPTGKSPPEITRRKS